MTAGMVTRTEPAPRRARQLIPAGLPRRGELIAACAVAAVLAHLLLAQLTLLLAVAFVVVSRATRWRLWWLLWPAAAGLAWALVAGPDQALAGFAAGPASVLRQLGLGGAAQPAGHPLAALSGIGRWLPRQLPVALPLAAAEATLAGWLAWLHTDEWAVLAPRPGVVAALRAAVATRLIGSGAVLTRDGCALGVTPVTGATAELGWTEIARGVLVTGADEREVMLGCLQVVHAALRRRKPVIVLDGGPGTAVGRALTAACRATGTPLLTDGGGADEDGWAAGTERAAGGNAAGGNSAAWGNVPAAGTAATGDTASASQLWGRGAGRPGRTPSRPGGGAAPIAPSPAGPSPVAPSQVCPSRADPAPAPASLSPAALTARLRRVVSDRTAALLPASPPELAARTCGALGSLAADLRQIGVDGDAVVWVPRAERLPPQALAALLRDGAAAGLAVLAGTTSPAAAAELTGLAGTTLIRRVTDPGLAATLAAQAGTRLIPAPAAAQRAGQHQQAAPPATGTMPAAELVPSPVLAARSLLMLGPAEFVLAVSAPRPRLVAAARLVPARLPRPPAPSAAGRRRASPAGRAVGAAAGEAARQPPDRVTAT